jgi:hypothetical protein
MNIENIAAGMRITVINLNVARLVICSKKNEPLIQNLRPRRRTGRRSLRAMAELSYSWPATDR